MENIERKTNADKKIRIAIDGPSGAGKSTLAKALAREFGIAYVDTGAIYRTVGYAVRAHGIEPSDGKAVAKILPSIRVEARFEGGAQKMYLDGEDLGERIREHEISHYASAVSAIPAVRAFLFDMQRDIVKNNSVIMDGRDIGTVIMPEADVKIFLSATAEDRAKRRYDELIARGQEAEYDRVLADMKERDARDASRAAAPLRAAPDAVMLDNSGFTLEESVAAAKKIISDKLGDA